MNFQSLLEQAQSNDRQAKQMILDLYRPLLVKESIVKGVFDEDLYQELCETLLKCIGMFRF